MIPHTATGPQSATGRQSLIAIALGIFVLPRAFKLGRESVRILVQEAPAHLDVGRIKSSDHATLQVEPQSHIGCTELSW